MSDLMLRVLGPVAIEHDGVPVSSLGRTTTNLLATLLLSANTAVPADTLIDRVWDGRDPEHPRAALHSGVARLRRLLGGRVLETNSWAYLLRTDADHFDLLRFDELVRDGDRDREEGRLAAARRKYDGASSLVRGQLLGNVDSPFLRRHELPALIERYLRLTELQAEIGLLSGQEEAVVRDLYAARRAYPLHERTATLLMTALTRCDRRSEALRVYETLRRSLSDELGIEPGVPMNRLYLRVLRGENTP